MALGWQSRLSRVPKRFFNGPEKPWIGTKCLVDIEGLDLIVGLAHLLVLAHEDNLSDPGERKGSNGESSR